MPVGAFIWKTTTKTEKLHNLNHKIYKISSTENGKLSEHERFATSVIVSTCFSNLNGSLLKDQHILFQANQK